MKAHESQPQSMAVDEAIILAYLAVVLLPPVAWAVAAVSGWYGGNEGDTDIDDPAETSQVERGVLAHRAAAMHTAMRTAVADVVLSHAMRRVRALMVA